MIKVLVSERRIEPPRICNFLKCTKEDIEEMFESENMDTEVLLKWSKLLEYDFFRIYSQHLILYAPPISEKGKQSKKISLPQFRKNIYTKEVINFILDRIYAGEMTKNEVIDRYKIPKTTLLKWIVKHGTQKK